MAGTGTSGLKYGAHVIISPEILIAEDVVQRLATPGATSSVKLADGKAHLISVICMEDCPVLHTQLAQLGKLFPDLSFFFIFITLVLLNNGIKCNMQLSLVKIDK